MKQNVRNILVCIMLLLTVFVLFFILRKEENSSIYHFEFYYDNACASCDAEGPFFELLKEAKKGLSDTIHYNLKTYNIFYREDRTCFQEKLELLNLEREEIVLPLLIMGDEYLGGYEAMETYLPLLLSGNDRTSLQITGKEAESESQAGEMSGQKDWENGQKQNTLILFTTVSCKDCLSVKTYLDEQEIEDCIIMEYNIMEEAYADLIQTYFEAYQVPKGEQQVPILFYTEGYLSGASAIKDKLSAVLESGAAKNFLPPVKREDQSMQAEDTPFSMRYWWMLLGTGFINGLNPCAASMLLMLLTVIAVYGKDVLKTGLIYMAGKLIAYSGMGVLFSKLASGILLPIQGAGQVISVLFIGAALILAALNFRDFYYARKMEYGKLILQLPKGLRARNHAWINRLKGKPAVYLLPLVFFTGLIISAGEFFCTGQVYLAVIVYMLKTEAHVMSYAAFFLYTLAMCLPQVLLIFLVYKTKKVNRISELMVANMPAAKLLTGGLFLLLAVLMLAFLG